MFFLIVNLFFSKVVYHGLIWNLDRSNCILWDDNQSSSKLLSQQLTVSKIKGPSFVIPGSVLCLTSDELEKKLKQSVCNKIRLVIPYIVMKVFSAFCHP